MFYHVKVGKAHQKTDRTFESWEKVFLNENMAAAKSQKNFFDKKP